MKLKRKLCLSNHNLQSVSLALLILVKWDLQKQREQKDSTIDPEKLASARRRLHENYQEAENGLLFPSLFPTI